MVAVPAAGCVGGDPQRRRLRQAGQFAVGASPCSTPRSGKAASVRSSLAGAGLLEGLLGSDLPAAEVLGTFMTWGASDQDQEQDDQSDDALLQQLRAAADAALHAGAGPPGGGGSGSASGSSESMFLARLRIAYADAVAAGDEEAAKAVLDAIKAEGGSLPEAPGCPAPGGRSPEEVPASRQSCRSAAQSRSPAQPGSVPGHSPASCVPTPPRAATRARPAAVARLSRFALGKVLWSPPEDSSTSNRSRMQDMISAQLEAATDAATPNANRHPCGFGSDTEQAEEEELAEEELAEEQEEQAEEAESNFQGSVRLGGIAMWPAESSPLFLQKAKEAQGLRKSKGGISGLSGLRIQIDSNLLSADSSLQELPASEIPACCQAAVVDWAWGRSSGFRCLLELASGLAPPLGCAAEASVDESAGLPGMASWRSLARLCGLAGGEELVLGPSSTTSTAFFAMAPRRCLRETLGAVRGEAGLAPGASVTLEELHLGLRSLELSARSGGGVDSEALIRAIAGRELLRAHFEGFREKSEKDTASTAQAFARYLALGTAEVEREARAESLEQLRHSAPPGWEVCRASLASMTRSLRDVFDMVHSYGPYAALGVECDVSDSAIRRAYRDLCLRHHPDKGGDTATFQSLQQAHETIMDDRKKGLRPRKPERKQRERSEKKPEKTPTDRAAAEAESPAADSRKQQGAAAHSARGEAAAEADQEELVREVANLSQRAWDASQQARAAADAAAASAAVVFGMGPADDDAVVVQEGMRALLQAMSAVVEGATTSATTALDASRRVVAAGVLGADGDLAEAVLAASLTCAEAGAAASDAAATCEALSQEAAAALRAAEGYEGAGAHALAHSGLCTAARRCIQAAGEAVEAAEAAARAVALALRAAQATVPGGCRPRGRMPSGASRGDESCSTGYPSPPAQHAQQRSKNSASFVVGGQNCKEDFQDSKDASAGPGDGPMHPSRSRVDRTGDPQPRPRSAASAESDGTSSTARPPRPPSADRRGRARETSSQMPSASGSPGGGARVRSSSAGARGRTEALVRRRLESFEELIAMNKEALRLQRQFHNVLLASPLLLPRACRRSRARVFAVVAEILLEVAREVSSCGGGQAACDCLPEMLSGSGEVAVCDSRAGVIRLAAILDLQMMTTVLKGQFLSILVEAQPRQKTALEKAMAKTADSLHMWVTGKL
ncbi:unnamed protein product [Polarella glacialis]|uniref:J domain-containing protein n=1 Tax=Polarella glacialis TaxID=89957 RepID=A0A813LL86_POLGL|nr:unnamed protein product [Polarella glacialis]